MIQSALYPIKQKQKETCLMYKVKEVARRGSALVAAASLLAGIGASALPGLASADSLNPLTQRSLTLSSSSPGWSYLDGSGNTTYAPPNSGANGQKTGNIFTFKTTSQADGVGANPTIKAFSFQYCIQAAGECTAPGNDAYVTGTPDTRGGDTATTSDLNVVQGTGAGHTPAEISSSDWTTIQARQSGVTAGLYAKTPKADNSEGSFVVLVGGVVQPGWSMSTTGTNLETTAVAAHDSTHFPTGKNNVITLVNSSGTSIPANASVEVAFYATNYNYITNPGSGAFFVRINDYSLDTDAVPTTSTHIVDGGVTVANVMNESISIQTKVLETMDFSVGTYDPDTYTDAQLTAKSLPVHGQCNTLLMADPTSSSYSTDPHNVLHLGDSTAEFSLRTDRPFVVNSYWRLSSNSSGGATVYYTGHTLTNTEGDQITPLQDVTSDIGAGLGTKSNFGTEQFGLGIDQTGANKNPGTDTYGSSSTSGDFANYVASNAKAHLPQLAPLVPTSNYGNAYGDGGGANPVPLATTGFAFNKDADSSAVPIASESTQVVDCVTAKMRYIANIAATTPAGLYTTKINYVASPQY
jgi:hypothetical protein